MWSLVYIKSRYERLKNMNLVLLFLEFWSKCELRIFYIDFWKRVFIIFIWIGDSFLVVIMELKRRRRRKRREGAEGRRG